MNTITIDCGASFIKGALFSDGVIQRKMQRSAPKVHSDADIFSAVQIGELLPIVREMVLELGKEEEEVCLCVSNEMHGFLLAYEDGMPLTDYISWQKEFGALEIKGTSAMQILNKPELSQEVLYTGMPLRKGLPSCNLLYLYMKESIPWQNGKKIVFYTLGDYIIRYLSGKEPMCHPTNAAATGLYDIVGKKWNTQLLQIVIENKVRFLTVGEEVTDFILENMRVYAYPAVGDQKAALLGSGLDKEDALSFILGTGAQVSKLRAKPNCRKGYQIRPYFQEKYLKTVPHIPSGRALNVYFRFVKDLLEKFQVEFSDKDIWDMFTEQISLEIDSDLTCDLSFFDNAVTGSEKGSIENIGEFDLTIKNIMTAVVNTMVKNFVVCAERIEGKAEDIKHIIFSGGIARKFEVLREQIIRYYPYAEKVDIAENETLIGLYQYGKMLSERNRHEKEC